MKKKNDERVALGVQRAGAGTISLDGDGAKEANATPKNAKRKKAKRNSGAKEKAMVLRKLVLFLIPMQPVMLPPTAMQVARKRIIRRVGRKIEILLQPLMSLQIQMPIRDQEKVLT